MPTTIATSAHPAPRGLKAHLARALDIWVRYHAEMISFRRGRL